MLETVLGHFGAECNRFAASRCKIVAKIAKINLSTACQIRFVDI